MSEIDRYTEQELKRLQTVLIRSLQYCGEQVLNNVIGGYVVGGYYVDKENNTVYICVEVQLPRLYAYISGEDVIKDYILYKVVSVVLFVVVLLDAGKGNCENGGIFACDFVCTLYKNSIVGLYMYSEGLIGIAVTDKNVVGLSELD